MTLFSGRVTDGKKFVLRLRICHTAQWLIRVSVQIFFRLYHGQKKDSPLTAISFKKEHELFHSIQVKMLLFTYPDMFEVEFVPNSMNSNLRIMFLDKEDFYLLCDSLRLIWVRFRSRDR